MHFRFIKKPSRDTEYQEWDLFISNEGITSRSGHLALTNEEFEALKSILIEGKSRYQDGEVEVTFEETSSTPAYTEGQAPSGSIDAESRALNEAIGRALGNAYPWGYSGGQKEP